MSDMRRSWRRATPKWQLVPVGVLAAVMSFLDFSTRLGASATCRALHAAAKTPTSVPRRLVVRAPRPCETRRRPPPALWSLLRLQTLRVARLVCFATADIAALQSLTRLRHLTATFDVRAVWRFPPALETLELTCAQDRAATQSYADVAPHSHAGVFASLSALRALTLDASAAAARYDFHLLPWPPNLVSLDYAGPLLRSDFFASLADRDGLTSFRCTDHLVPAEFQILGTRRGLRRLHLSTFGLTIPADIVAGGLFAALRELTFAWTGVGDAAQRHMAIEIARMPALEKLCVREYSGESLRDLIAPVGGGGGFRALTALSVADARQFATLAGIDYFAATLRSLDASGTAVRDASGLGLLTNLVRLRLDGVRPTIGKNIVFPAASLPSVRRLSIHGSDHWRWTARQTFPNAEITPPLTGTEIVPRPIASSLLLRLPVAST